ncbi:hypothetical protein D0662_18650 [Salmonella enterica]|nr:hypothetical protein [Salmonella enterica]
MTTFNNSPHHKLRVIERLWNLNHVIFHALPMTGVKLIMLIIDNYKYPQAFIPFLDSQFILTDSVCDYRRL